MHQSEQKVNNFSITREDVRGALNRAVQATTSNQAALCKFKSYLNNPPQRGQGCHSGIMSGANLGVIAGLQPEQIFAEIRAVLGEKTPDKEIQEAIEKAAREYTGTAKIYQFPKKKPLVQDGKTALQKIINAGKFDNDADLWEASPKRLFDDPAKDAVLFLQTMFDPDDLIFIGDGQDSGIVGMNILPAAEWVDAFQKGRRTKPYLIINPLDGVEQLTKSGKPSFRCDANVQVFKYSMAEFDDLSHSDQIRFWSGVKLEIKALVDTGGKSIHAWLEVSKLAAVSTADEWDSQIRERLYKRVLTPLGVDSTCSNQSRLSRLPGHFRAEKKKMQKILWLSNEGQKL
ncbi:MAG: hypothetical protein RBT11_17880 [Desulfobacterales bacterium]|jgi:hypothetical protein|nr:hypothetical protein [Desulfobacterales bacterium]